MIERLRLRIRPEAREPAHSVAARLATRHGLPIGPFVRSLGLNIRSLASGKCNERLAVLASADLTAIDKATASFAKIGRGVTLFGERLSWVDWSVGSRRACAGCLHDDRSRAPTASEAWSPWHRSWWDVQVIGSCPLHNRALIDRCPRCGEALDWESASIDRCARGHLLGDEIAPSYQDPTVDAYLLGRLDPLRNIGVSPFLDQFSIGAAARIVERLGAISNVGWAPKFPDCASAQAFAGHRKAGWDLAVDMECRLREALDRVLQQAPGEARGLTGRYGWIYASWLGVPGADHSGGLLLSILKKHAADHGVISEAERGQSSTTVSLMTASSLLAKSRNSSKAIAHAAGILPSGSRPGVRFRIQKGELEKIARRVSTLVDSQTGATMLGIGRPQYRSLVDQGLLKHDEGARALGYRQLFDPQLLSDFEAALSGPAPHVRQSPASTIPLPAACRIARVPLWKFSQLILSNEIVPVATTEQGHGLARILIAAADVRRIQKPRSWEAARIVATALCIHREAATHLIRAGVFGDPPEVTPRSLLAFADRYAKPSDLAGPLGRSSRSVVHNLSEAGFRPAFGPPDCRQLFYLRQEASALLQVNTPPTLH